MTVLVVAELDRHALKADTLHAVMAACQVSMFSDGQIHVLVAGSQALAAAEQAVRITGVSKVVVANLRHLGVAGDVAAQVLSIAAGYSHILFPATSAGDSTALRVAKALRVTPIDNITRVLSPDNFECRSHAGPAVSAASGLPGAKVITVFAKAFEAASDQGGLGHIEYLTKGWDFAVRPSSFSTDRPTGRHRADGRTQGGYLTSGGHPVRQRAYLG
jgi:electron transfer flavoprotein alpha subunit